MVAKRSGLQTSDKKASRGLLVQGEHVIYVLQTLRTLTTLIAFTSQSSSMPRGACENCGRHDAFVYAIPLAFGRNLLVCTRCLNLPRARENEDEDEGMKALTMMRHKKKPRLCEPGL